MFKWLLFIGLSLFSTLSSAEQKAQLSIAAEHYPPYEMEAPIDGLRGFDYEVVTEAFSLIGYHLKVEFLPWKRALQYAKLGKTVAILSCAYQKERAEYLIFSDPISEFVSGFYVRKGYSGPEPILLEDVKGQRVASVKGYDNIKNLEAIGIKPVAANNIKAAVEMLIRKRFDYLYLAQQPTDFIVKQMELTDQLSFYPMSKKEYHLCFSKQYQDIKPIIEAFNSALSILRKNGTFQTIHNKYK